MKTIKKLSGLTVLFMIAALVIIGCAPAATSTPTNGDGNGDGSAEVTMQGNAFQPAEITVSAGTTITWTNMDAVAHTVVSGTRDAATDLFDASVAAGGSFSFTFDEPGTYDYFCSIHPGMDGTVIVE